MSGDIIGFIGFILNITEQKLAEADLTESDARYRDLYNNAPFAYVSNNPNDGSFTNCNQAFVDLLGYSRDELTCMNIRQLLFDETDMLQRLKAVFEPADLTKPVESLELQLKHKDGTVVWATISVIDRKDPSGKIIERRATIVDITEQKLAEEALKESEEQLDTITSFTPVALIHSDRDGFITFVNEAFLRLYGRVREEMLRDGWADAIHPEDREKVEEVWTNCVKTGETVSVEYRIIQSSGRVVKVFSQTAPVRDDGGDVIGHIGTLTDVTDQKSAN